MPHGTHTHAAHTLDVHTHTRTHKCTCHTALRTLRTHATHAHTPHSTTHTRIRGAHAAARQVVVNDTVEETAQTLLHIIEHIRTAPQWLPASWADTVPGSNE